MGRVQLCGVLVAVALALVWTGCAVDGGGEGSCDPAYPGAGSEAGTVLHVATSCQVETPDGSASRPYSTISEALETAESGTVIVVAPGTYAENLTITTDGIAILGSSDPDDSDKAGIILQSPDPTASITAFGASDVLLRGFDIQSPIVAGVWVVGGSATVEGSRISDAQADADGQFGFGILGTAEVGIILQRTAITGSAMTGVLIQDGKGTISITDCTLSDNGRGGIRLENIPDGATISGNQLTSNLELGIGVFSGVGIILQNNGVHDTQGDQGGVADGIVVAELKDGEGTPFGASEVEIGGDPGKGDGHLGNTVTGSERIGVLISGDVAGIILQNEASVSGFAGIWLQKGAGGMDGISVTGNMVTDNSFLGISVGAGTYADIQANTITDTEEGQFIDPKSIGTIQMGDGIGVFDGASATIRSNIISFNARAGILGDGLDMSGCEIADNTFEGNGNGDIVLQNVGVTAAEVTADGSVEVLPAGAGVSVLLETNDPDGFEVGGSATDLQ